MFKTAIIGTIIALALSACGSSSGTGNSGSRSNAAGLVSSTPNAVVMNGVADARKSSPPASFTETATRECAKHNKRATYFSMDAKSAKVTEVTFICVPKR